MEEQGEHKPNCSLQPRKFLISEVLTPTVYKGLLKNKTVLFPPIDKLTHQLQNHPLAVFSHHY